MNIKKYRWMPHVLMSCMLCFISLSTVAETKIAILDFELKDLTMIPRTTAEIERTASIKPLLETELKKADYVIIDIPIMKQKNAAGGVGYLFDHDDIAANLAKQYGADYVLVGRLHKPSFLFAYLMGHLVRVKDAKLIGNYISEAKGPNKKLTVKTVESLTVKIDRALDQLYSPPSKHISH